MLLYVNRLSQVVIAIYYARDAKTARDAGFRADLLASRQGGASGTVKTARDAGFCTDYLASLHEDGTDTGIVARDAGFRADLLASLETYVYICVRLNLILP